MKHVVLAWQCFQKLTDARGAFTHTPCVYVQIDSNSGQVRIGKASKRSCPNWFLKIRNLDSIQFAVSAPSGVRKPPKGTVKLSRICPFCGRILLDQRLRINDLAVAAGGENAAKLLNLTVPIVVLMALDLPVPNYSTVSRRQSAVDVRLSVGPTDRPRHVVIDSTGLKIYGAGEWHIRKHRTLRRRTWRKLHLGVDETTKEIVAMDLTASNVHDARRLSSLLSKTPGSIRQVSADRAYDTGSCYEAVLQHDAIVTILPRRNARCSRDSHPPPWRAMRDTHLRRIRTQGRYEWRKSSGCTRQSVAENAVSRYKAILGVSLSARTVKNQKVEAAIKCAVLNRMAELGMPRSERVY